MAIHYSSDIILNGLRHCFDTSNTKSYTSGTDIKDLITGAQGTNGIANSNVSWMNDGVYTTTIIAIITRLAPISGYAINPLTKYSSTTDNTFNLYMFGNFGGAAPADDGRLGYYSNLNGSWASVGTQYGCQINETVMYTLQYNSGLGGQTWANSTKLGSRTGSGRLGSVGNTSGLIVATPPYTSTLKLQATYIYDRELSDQEIGQNFAAIRGRFGL